MVQCSEQGVRKGCTFPALEELLQRSSYFLSTPPAILTRDPREDAG